MHHAPVTLARLTGILDDLTGATARRTGARDAEETLLESNLPMTVARAAGCRAGGTLTARAAAFATSLVAGVRNLLLRTEGGFFERKFEIVSKVGTALGTLAAAAAAKQIAKSEDVAKNVTEIREDVGIETAESAGAADTGMSVAVVCRALLRVAQHGVRFSRFLKSFFRLGISRIAIRVILHGKFSVSRLDLAVGRSPTDAEDLVIVLFRCTQKTAPTQRLRR
jgi:hypothetical protein